MSDPTVVQRLLPPPAAPVDATQALADLELEPRDPLRPRLVLNMVSSVDGRATLDGRSGGLSNTGDRELFHALRARADAVMAGAGTIRAERYGPLVRSAHHQAERRAHGLAAQPLAVIASRSLRLDQDVPLLADPESRVVLLTGADGVLEGCAAQIDYLRGADLAAQLAGLRARHKVRLVVCEGGPTFNAALLAAGLVDDLFLSVAPVLVGGSDPLTIVSGRATRTALTLVRLMASGNHLHAQYAVER